MNGRAHLVSELSVFHFEIFPFKAQLYRIPLHVHHTYQLDLYLHGQVMVRCESGEHFLAGPAEGVLIPPLFRHGFEFSPGLTQATFKLELHPHAWRCLVPRVQRFRIPPNLLQLVLAASEYWSREDDTPTCLLLGVAEACLGELLRTNALHESSSQPASGNPRISALIQEVGGNPERAWSVAELARMCRLSQGHFSRLFANEVGQTPQRFILETRMRAAASTLAQSDAPPVKSVANIYGYSTIHAFSRAFKKVFGTGPATYRKSRVRF
ncbi:MAG: helix-turn-helix domain-containing protein [Lentisphaeria bacterium]|nr:helix-turn-helix domain-containing protein [Lentisphaeria bacterium]